ncbi:hypothetical protein FRC01_012999, partial [Tulasnella sp. 417]
MDSSYGRTSSLQDQQFARPTIHDLPFELLSHIIYLFAQDYSSHLTRIQNLCYVCSKWRDVVEGTPRLWCQLSGGDPLQGVKKAIHYSRDHPLDIDYNWFLHRHGSAKDDFFSAVSLHTWRWRHVSIVVEKMSESLRQGWGIWKAPR